MKKTLIIFLFLFFNKKIVYSKSAPESFADIIQPLLPSVVSIASTTIAENREQDLPQNFPQFPEGSPLDEFFKEYFDQQQKNNGQTRKPLLGLGSGFVIDKKGIIVTNAHVIEGADEITVIMEDGKEFEAELIGNDDKADIAVIRVDPGKYVLKSVDWGDSDLARVGDWTIAIGNPLGLGGTVTAGVVSAIARDIGGGPYVKFIQTDASINKGNSGGPLFNTNGEVIGINSAIITQSEGSIGLGFAIPSNSAKRIVNQLVEYGRTKRGWLGVQIQGLTEEIAESLGLSNTNGAFIASVQTDSPAYKAGIEAGDVILKFNNTTINSYRDLPRVVAETDVGSEVNVEIWREDKIRNFLVKLGELDEPNSTIKNKTVEEKSTKIKSIGVTVRELSKDDFENLNLSEDTTGVFVLELENDNTNLNIGDIITEVNREKVNNIKVFKNYIDKHKKTGRNSLLLKVIRDNNTFWATLKYIE